MDRDQVSKLDALMTVCSANADCYCRGFEFYEILCVDIIKNKCFNFRIISVVFCHFVPLVHYGSSHGCRFVKSVLDILNIVEDTDIKLDLGIF